MLIQQIVHEINEAQNLDDALQLIVERVAIAMSVEACSIYLVCHRQSHYVLGASVGFHQGVKGKVILRFSEGLIGLVGEREEPINLSEAQSHPAYRYFPETGEERYQAFLGVPIIHQRKLVGILVVQQREPRRFNEGEEAFLVTVCAQLAGYIAHAQLVGIVSETTKSSAVESMLRGIPASPGIAVGKVMVPLSADLECVVEKQIEDIPKEIESFEQALALTQQDIARLKSRLDKMLLPEEQNLFDAYLKILESRSIKNDIIKVIEEGQWAPFALRKIIKRQVRKFEAMEDPYLRERASDLIDLGQRVLINLQNEHQPEQIFSPGTILISEEISASTLAEIPPGNVVALVSAKGSASSHAAILARAMGIPAVMGVPGLPLGMLQDREIVVDGYNGEIFTSPSPLMLANFEKLVEEEKQHFASLEKLRDVKSETKDGFEIPLCVNTGLVADIKPAIHSGADGVGLYRTEVPFMIRDRFPSEEEQYLIYRQLLESFAPKAVTIRTLDIGGDKFLPYFKVEESNPFLGWRGIRVTLDHPEIFLLQLRAMIRASHGLNNLQVLFPMVSNLSEVEEALTLLEQAYNEVIQEGTHAAFPKTGVMIEVPSTIFQASSILKKVDFLSVGSNDLTQYLLAVDRNNVHVANMYDPLHPAVIRALQTIVEAAQKVGKPVSICGEMAGDPLAVIVLIGLGFDMLSMNANSIPRIKWLIRHFTKAKAKSAVEAILEMQHVKEIRQYLKNLLEEQGLARLVRLVAAC